MIFLSLTLLAFSLLNFLAVGAFGALAFVEGLFERDLMAVAGGATTVAGTAYGSWLAVDGLSQAMH